MVVISGDIAETVVAIITARGGSKRLSHKNVLNILGKPMIAYSIEAALCCDHITDVYVTTDDQEISDVSLRYGAGVIKRPNDLATDTASSYDAVKHAIEYLNDQGQVYDYFALLQPTSPLRDASHLSAALSAFFENKKYRCCISVSEAEHSPYKMFTMINGELKPLFNTESLGAAHQSLDNVYRQNGAIYIMKCQDLLTKTESFYLEPTLPFVMSPESSIDIDNQLDLEFAEHLLKSRNTDG